jgi:hypothetical protein
VSYKCDVCQKQKTCSLREPNNECTEFVSLCDVSSQCYVKIQTISDSHTKGSLNLLFLYHKDKCIGLFDLKGFHKMDDDVSKNCYKVEDTYVSGTDNITWFTVYLKNCEECEKRFICWTTIKKQ